MEVWEWAEGFIQEFRDANCKLLPSSVGSNRVSSWKAPSNGVFKINSDAALCPHRRVAGIGVVIRDSRGFVMASLCQRVEAAISPQVAEAMAIRRGLILAAETGLLPVVLDSDALEVVKEIESLAISSADIGLIIYDIRCLLRFPYFISVNFVPRLENKVAHRLASMALDFVGEFVWMEDCPLAVQNLVLGDSPASV